MASPVELLGTYLHLARAAELRRQPLVRDRLLVLAAVIAAQSAGLVPIAAACRERILRHNPGHLIGNWPTVSAAMQTADFSALVEQIARRFSPEEAEQLLAQLGIERGAERRAYFSDGEYAAALLGEDWAALRQRFGASD
ncbi:MAG: hypothetical protein SFU86_22860 [Pirellulaceae bacterium]|nr:hypothetical protein [Pirellulaceae bacterium]